MDMDPFAADNFSKYRIKVILSALVHNNNTQFTKTVYFESNLIHLQQCFEYLAKHC